MSHCVLEAEIRLKVSKHSIQDVQDDITNHTKNHEKHNLSEKRQSTDTNSEMNQMMRLSEKDLKVTIVKMILQATINVL